MQVRTRVFAAAIFAGVLGASGSMVAVRQQPSSDTPLPDYDVRAGRAPATAPAALQSAVTGAPRQGGRRAIRLHAQTGAVRVLDRPDISAPRGASANAVRAMLASAASQLGLERGELASLDVIRDYTSASTGLRHVIFSQSFEGIPVFDAVLSVHIDRSGQVIRITSSAAHTSSRAANRTLSAADAALEAARNVRPNVAYFPVAVDGPSGASARTRFARGPFRSDVDTSLVWLPIDGGLRLAWQVSVEPDGIPQLYDILIDAETAEVLVRRNRVRYAEGSGRVMQSDATQLRDPRLPDPMPGAAGTCPPPANHQMRSLTAPFRDASSVLFNHGGLEGNNTLVLRGNTSTPAATGSFDGTQWIFDFPFNSAGAAETSLFFAANFAHDFFYDLGFDEAAGNFQANNFGRGGLGGDSLRVVARAAGRNNATFQPEAEGTSPVMSVFLWDGSGCWADDVDGDGTPDLDGSYDLDIVLHEFHHGVSQRLNTAFTGSEADAIGEGASDFFAYSVNGDTTLADYSRPGGIRSVNAKTYGDWSCLLGFFCEPHSNGEIFANVLWDVRERFRTDVVRGSEAAAVNESHQLYVDALKLSPPAPTMLDIRDAMLLADSLRNPDGAESQNFCRVWESFAARGMGVNATDTADNGSNQVGPDSSVPTGCNAPPPPPTITLTASTATATESGPGAGVFTISRGEVRDSATTVNYTISGTAVRGTDYETIPTSAVIAAGAVSVDVVITPIDDSQVESNETVTLKVAASSGYTVGAPSSGTVTIVSDDTAADLVVSSVVAPTTGGSDVEIDVSDVTKNQGSADAPESTTSFFLSSNSTWDTGDKPLGTRSVGPLAPAETNSATTRLTLPSNLETGTYFVLAKADGSGAVAEVSETNNVKYDSIRIGPDLVVGSLTVPATAGQGGTILITDTTRNSGGGAAPASSTRFYLSVNGSKSADDIPLAVRSVPALASGAENAANTSATIPATVTTGTYYVVAAADDADVVDETSESNNGRYDQIRIGPDLQVSSLSAPARAASGATISVPETTRNAGQAGAGASTTAYYLSPNTSLSADDFRLSSRSVGPLAAGASSSATASLTLPAAAPGLWYLIAVADEGDAVTETFESNNTRYDSMLIGPDLDMTSISAPTTAVAGATISISSSTKNIGAEAAPASTTRFYLSLNTSFDSSDTLLGERMVPALASNISNTGTVSVVLPSDMIGKYYIIAVADAAGVVEESSESNNTIARAITISK